MNLLQLHGRMPDPRSTNFPPAHSIFQRRIAQRSGQNCIRKLPRRQMQHGRRGRSVEIKLKQPVSSCHEETKLKQRPETCIRTSAKRRKRPSSQAHEHNISPFNVILFDQIEEKRKLRRGHRQGIVRRFRWASTGYPWGIVAIKPANDPSDVKLKHSKIA